MPGLTADVFAPLAAEASALAESLRRSVVLVRSGHGHGSGVIWESDGLIVTNHHVVSRDRAEVELADGRQLSAAVVARDPHNDLAALRVPARDLPAVSLGDSTALRIGELLVAVGHPFGVRGTITLGIVSAIGNATGMGRWPRELLQADMALAPGNSGGPLANTTGGVVGIASMVIQPGIALAVPSHVVHRFLSATEPRPRLGVTFRPVTLPHALPASLNANGHRNGLLLLEIEDGSPAEAAGLLPGDVLLELDGRAIDEPAALGERLARHGSPLRVTLWRGGGLQQKHVDLEQQTA